MIYYFGRFSWVSTIYHSCSPMDRQTDGPTDQWTDKASVGPWWSSWEWWKCIESSKYLRLLHHSVDSWLVYTSRITLHHSTWLMQYCIILNKLSRMWTHRCTPGVLVEKRQHLKKHRILAGLIHFSRLKLAFFKKVAFLPTQQTPVSRMRDLHLKCLRMS